MEMKKIGFIFSLVLTILTLVTLFAAPVYAQPSPPPNPDTPWQPPETDTEVLTSPSARFSLNSVVPPPPVGTRGRIINAYLHDQTGNGKTDFIANEIFFLVFSVNGPGWFYLYEYYPQGSGPQGHWLLYNNPIGGGVYELGPFYPESNEPKGTHTWRIGYRTRVNYSEYILRWNYYVSEDDRLPAIDSFTCNPGKIVAGDSVNLAWAVSNATGVSIDPVLGSGLPASGSRSVQPNNSATYTLTASNKFGTRKSTVNVSVEQPNPPTINNFTADSLKIDSGNSVLLSWTVSDATNISIEPSIAGGLQATGSTSVSPTQSTTYTLVASNKFGTTRGNVTIAVNTPWTLYLLIGLLVAAALAIAFLVSKRFLFKPQPVKQHSGGGTSFTQARTIEYPQTKPIEYPQAKTTVQPVTEPVTTLSTARLVMAGASDILLSQQFRTIGRADLAVAVPFDKRTLVSRQHFTLDNKNGTWYIEDSGSSNGTKLNGSEIKGTGQHALKEGDKIDVAGLLTITFRSL
jgi:hypothetical protein